MIVVVVVVVERYWMLWLCKSKLGKERVIFLSSRGKKNTYFASLKTGREEF